MSFSNTTIVKDDEDWKRFSKLLKAVKGKNTSVYIREVVKKELKKLEKEYEAMQQSRRDQFCKI